MGIIAESNVFWLTQALLAATVQNWTVLFLAEYDASLSYHCAQAVLADLPIGFQARDEISVPWLDGKTESEVHVWQKWRDEWYSYNEFVAHAWAYAPQGPSMNVYLNAAYMHGVSWRCHEIPEDSVTDKHEMDCT